MSMLADRKKRDKWSINPRGKAWVEDQTKFGQRLLEKMGWSAGQGLGVNNQGPTEVVKVMKKDNTKGFGFKDKGDEWLKKTSEFNELLDELRSNGEKDTTEQEVVASSLEDRSKKSKSRVHYKKFTRGKDLSRYSEKDLASIIGPDVVKTKQFSEGDADYTTNQVNKGSSSDYFKQIQERSLQYQALENHCGEEANNSSEEAACSSSHKKNKKLEELEKEPDIESDTKTKSSSKKKKEKKALHNNDDYDHQTQETCDTGNDVNSVSKKKKKKLQNETDCDVEQSSAESHVIVKGKKRKRNCDNEGSTHMVQKVEEDHSEETTVINESSINSEDISRKKRNKKHGKNDSMEFSEEIVSLDNGNVNKKRNKKNKMKHDHDIDMVLATESITPLGQQKQTCEEKKKKKGVKNSEIQEISNTDLIQTQMLEGKPKPKKSKKKLKNEENLEDQTISVPSCVQTPVQTEQMIPHENDVELLEVLGRKTRLKKINMPTKLENHLKYKTEEFMAFTSLNPENNFPSREEIIQTESKDSCYIATNNNTQPIKIYGVPNEKDCNIPKHVIAYEYRLLTKKLQQLNLVAPSTIRVIIKDSSTLSQATHKKLKTLHKSKHLKGLLPPNDLVEIEACVERFHEELQPKISMMKTLDEIEEKTMKFAKEMMGKSTLSDPNLAVETEENGGSSMHQNCNTNTILQNLSKELNSILKTFKGKIENVPAHHHQSELAEPSNRKRSGKNNSRHIHFGQESGDSKDSSGENDEQLRDSYQIRIKERLNVLVEQVKLLKEGKIPCDFESSFNKEIESAQETLKNNIGHQGTNYQALDMSNKDSNYFGGRGHQNYQRGSSNSCGISMTPASPQYCRSLRISERVDVKTQNISSVDEFESQTLIPSRGSQGNRFLRGRSGLRSSVPLRGGRAIQSFEGSSENYNSYSGRGQAFRGRFGVLRGTFRGRFELRGRNRISKNNFDAKQYAEKCKALNKVPEIAFKGVDLKIISGYAVDKTVGNS